MTTLRLIALDDTVVFPGMTITLPIDVGEDRRVFLVPRHGNDYATVGVVAEVVEQVRLPGGGNAGRADAACTAVSPGRPRPGPDGSLRVEVEERPDETPPASRTADLEREYRAVVEEILELRGDDDRVRAFVRSITEPGALADTAGYAPGPHLRAEARAAADARRRRAARRWPCACSASAWPSCRCASASARTSSRRPRSSSASTSCAASSTRSARSSARTTARWSTSTATKIAEAGMPDAVREQAERELGRFEKIGEQSPESSIIRTYLDWLLAVPWSERSEERLDPVHARSVLDADHAGLDDVKERITEYLAVRKLRVERGVPDDRRSGVILTLDRPAGNRQDLDRRVDRARHRPQVRAHVARRRARRGRDPRPPPHLHRRAAGPPGARPARRRHDEPGHHARRGRQARRRLARRSVLGPARGARPGAEPLLPRPLPRRRARPLAGALHRHRQRGRHDPAAAARPHGGDPLRRLHDRREGGDRARLPVAAPGRAQRPARRTRSRSTTPCCAR